MDRMSTSERLKAKVKRGLARLDVHAGRHSNTLAGARRSTLAGGNVDVVIDVGAHAGEYGSALRKSGYKGQIISFEPVMGHFERLLTAAENDSKWECHNRAAGARAEMSTISISANDGFSSSLLPMTEAHEDAATGSHFEAEQTIEIISLDETLAVPSPPILAGT